jgi:hypothetical protein
LGHLFGNALKQDPYKDSLDAVSGKQAAILPVFLTAATFQKGLNILEKAAFPSLRHSVVIDGLGEKAFLYKQSGADSPDFHAEYAYIDQIRKACGDAFPVLD